ncbi:MAG: signal peptide peptidase SppA [Candidatus Sumerlaeia bacterium]|nr:signal peptide peptidase SppA [Candidatus Sumerlaeia bacterium]
MIRLAQILLIMLVMPLFTACMFVNIPLSLPSRDYREVVVQDGRYDEKVLILDIDGGIFSGPQQENPLGMDQDSMVNQVAGKLKKAKDERNLKAVILRIDSPGGGVTASDVIYKMLADFRRESGIPIYASMLDVAASGGYYVAMAADEVYAHPTSITGSIGVIAVIPQLEGLGQKIGVHMEIIKSGDNKDLGGIFKNMSDDQRRILQGVIDDLHNRFIEVIKIGRPKMTEEQIRNLADGRIFTANEALELELIDGIMYLDELIEHVRRKHRLRDPRVVFYRRTVRDTYSSVYAHSGNILPNDESPHRINVGLINVGTGSHMPARPVFQYLWVH